MDLQRITGAGRFRSLLFRALLVVGGAVAGTALAWLLSSATAAAAENPPVPGLLGSTVSTLDPGRLLGVEVLPEAPVVPRLRVDTHQLVVPVVAVEQRLSEVTEHTLVSAPVQQAAAVHEARPAAEAPVSSSVRVAHTEQAVERQVAAAVVNRPAITSSSAPAQPRPTHGPNALPPFTSFPNGSFGHDGPSGPGGFCLSEGVPVIPGTAVTRLGEVSGQWVPVTTGRQPGITPD